MIKTWLIKASAPICGINTYYLAYSEDNPKYLEDWVDMEIDIIQDLWDNYSWCLHLDDEEYDSEEEEQEVYDQAFEDWRCDCEIIVEEVESEEEIEEVAPGGDIESIDVIYDER